MSPKKVVSPVDIYVRVSDVRGRQGDSFISPDAQENTARALCHLRGYEVGRVLTDLDQTGGKMDRPAFNEAMRRALTGESGGIVVAKLDRFARNVKGLLEYVDELEKVGAVWACAEPTIDTGDPDFGRFLLTLFGAMAELERGRIGSAWQTAKASAVERGIHISAKTPPGYKRGDDRRLIPDGKHAETMREAFRRAAAGQSYSQIAAYLNERRLPSGGNKTNWQANRIKRLLANRVYLGEARSGNGHTNANAHEPLVSQTDFLLAQRGETGVSIKPTTDYLLSGLCRCAACMYAMRPQKARGKTIATYRCQTDTSAGRCPQPSSIGMSRLDEYVLEQFLDRLTTGSSNESALETDDSAALAAIEAARAEVEEIEALKGSIRPAAYAQALDAALEQLEAAEAALPRRAVYGDVIADAATQTQAMLERFEAGSNLRDLVGDDVATFRSLLAAQIQAVLVSPAASRSRNLPIGDRVRIMWADEAPLTLPKRGERFTMTEPEGSN